MVIPEGNMEITYVAMFQNGDIEKARKYIVENADLKILMKKFILKCMKILNGLVTQKKSKTEHCWQYVKVL